VNARAASPANRALTFIEVLLCLLVLGLGMLSAIALARYGTSLAQQSIADSLAWPTAASVMCNARQDELGAGCVLDWTKTGSVWSGYVNGLYVKRTLSDPVDPVDAAGQPLGVHYRTVTVDVYPSAESGRPVRFRERMVFHDR